MGSPSSPLSSPPSNWEGASRPDLTPRSTNRSALSANAPFGSSVPPHGGPRVRLCQPCFVMLLRPQARGRRGLVVGQCVSSPGDGSGVAKCLGCTHGEHVCEAVSVTAEHRECWLKLLLLLCRSRALPGKPDPPMAVQIKSLRSALLDHNSAPGRRDYITGRQVERALEAGGVDPRTFLPVASGSPAVAGSSSIQLGSETRPSPPPFVFDSPAPLPSSRRAGLGNTPLAAAMLPPRSPFLDTPTRPGPGGRVGDALITRTPQGQIDARLARQREVSREAEEVERRLRIAHADLEYSNELLRRTVARGELERDDLRAVLAQREQLINDLQRRLARYEGRR